MEIKKTKLSESPLLTDITGFEAVGFRKNIDGTTDLARASMDLLLAGTPVTTFSINDNGELEYEITYQYVPR